MLCPAQIVDEVGVNVITGIDVTFTVAVLIVLTQDPLLPVTVYTVVAVGDTTELLPEPLGDQV